MMHMHVVVKERGEAIINEGSRMSRAKIVQRMKYMLYATGRVGVGGGVVGGWWKWCVMVPAARVAPVQTLISGGGKH